MPAFQPVPTHFVCKVGVQIFIARWTALHSAAYSGQSEVAKLLITSEANVSIIDDIWNMTPLHIAAQRGHVDVAKILIDSGAEIDLLPERGMTPLFAAIDKRKLGMTKFLLEAGANPNIIVEYQKRPW